MQDLNARIEKLRAEIDGAEAEIRTYAALRGAMQYTIDYFSMRIEKYDVLGRLWQSPHVFVITGYIPAESAPALEKELTEKFEAYVELETPAEDEDVPVKLKNNAFAAPVEVCSKATACRAGRRSTPARSWRSFTTSSSA